MHFLDLIGASYLRQRLLNQELVIEKQKVPFKPSLGKLHVVP